MNNSEATDKIICRVRSKSALRLFGFSMVFAPAAFILAYSPARNERPLYKTKIYNQCACYLEKNRAIIPPLQMCQPAFFAPR